MDSTPTTLTDAEDWERSLHAFLAEKERRSGSWLGRAYPLAPPLLARAACSAD